MGTLTRTLSLSPLLLSSACAVFGVHPFDESKAREYAHLDVNQFVKTRFVDEQHTFLDRMNSGMASMNAASGSQPLSFEVLGKTGLREDGRSVVYEASFNAVNNGQLGRPRKELELYCQARSGRLQVQEVPTGNFVSQNFEDGVRRRMQIARPPSSSARHVHIGPKGGSASGPGFERQDGEAGYARAAQNGAFGRFACTRGEQQLWVVSVSPLAYLTNDPYDSLSTHQMTVLIDPAPGVARPAAQQLPAEVASIRASLQARAGAAAEGAGAEAVASSALQAEADDGTAPAPTPALAPSLASSPAQALPASAPARAQAPAQAAE